MYRSVLKQRRRGSGQRRSGIALLIVLAIIVLLSTLAYSFHDMVASQLRISRKDVDRFRALQLARAGLNLGLTLIKLDPQFNNQNYTYIPDPSYKNKQFERGVELNPIEEVYLMLHGSEEGGIPLEGGMVSVAIRDETARLNVNAALQAPNFLLNLLRIANVRKRKKLIFSDTRAADDISMQLTNAILDWVDPDNSSRPEGAESSWYSSKEPKYKARNGPMESLDELMLLRHMDRSIMNGVPKTDQYPGSLPISDFLTVFGQTVTVNANSAPVEVLAAVPGIYESQNRQAIINEIITQRPIQNPGALQAVISTHDSTALAKAGRFLTTNSNTIRFDVKAKLGSYEARIQTVVTRDQRGVIRTIYWKES